MEKIAEQALTLLRSRLSDPLSFFSLLSSPSSSSSYHTNYTKLKFIISSTLTEASNNSVLLLGPRGCGKSALLNLVLNHLFLQFPDTISVIRLNGLLHSDDNCALKGDFNLGSEVGLARAKGVCVLANVHLDVGGVMDMVVGAEQLVSSATNRKKAWEIARQLCVEHKLLFTKMASFDDNTQFVIDMLRECGLAHKTIVFVLDEFDLFAQGKQRLLYSLLDAMQSVTSQAIVIGISCRLDADQLLEKRVRSRFSHRKLLFCPPSSDELERLLECALSLPVDSNLPQKYVLEFNKELHNLLADKRFKDTMNMLLSSDSTADQILRFLFLSVSSMDLKTGMLSIENFKLALARINRQPKLDYIKDNSVLELYILVCMKRLETREQNSYNFNSVMKEYKAMHDSFQTPDYYARNVCLRAFEHLIQCELICFVDNRGYNQSIEFRPVKLLISPYELHQGLKLNPSCPSILQKLLDQTGQKL